MGLVKNNTGLEEISQSVANVENISTEIQNNIININTNIQNIEAKLATIEGGLSSCIKSITFGTKTPDSGTFTVSVPNINVNKTIVLLRDDYSSYIGSDFKNYVKQSYCTSKTSTKITINSGYYYYQSSASGNTRSGYSTTQYQIIEFY